MGMSGHSKWANIKHKKEKTDAQRGKIFTKLGREIAVAVKESGPDPENNSRLRDAIAKAKSSNMPNDTIDRSIKKAAGSLGDVNYEEIVYEGYGTDGVAVIVHSLTDNKNRTAGEIRYIFDRNGGSLGATGCVGWMFERKGLIVIDAQLIDDADEFMLLALEYGAEDISENDDTFEITTDLSQFNDIKTQLEKNNYTFIEAQVTMIPQNTVELSEDQAGNVLMLIEKLEENDDVQNVYHNLEIV
jgi:YebC/PmpR family DNA-binding regulatory protein